VSWVIFGAGEVLQNNLASRIKLLFVQKRASEDIGIDF
jgi:hypothetical protein